MNGHDNHDDHDYVTHDYVTTPSVAEEVEVESSIDRETLDVRDTRQRPVVLIVRRPVEQRQPEETLQLLTSKTP